jgi:hypothetical protein
MDEVEEKKPRRGRRKLFRGLIAVIVLLLMAAASAGYWFFLRTEPNPIPKGLRAHAAYQLYYPSDLPKGLSVDKNSFKESEENQAIIFSVKGNDRVYYVSLQPYPDSFDFSEFKKKFNDSDEVNTPIGSLFVGELASQLIGSIRTTDETWVIVNVADSTAGSELNAFLRSFEKL